MAQIEQRAMPNLWFRLMALEYSTRSKPALAVDMLNRAGICEGMNVLDFGCGPGRYTVPTAWIVGSGGVVYALDIHPLAIRMVENKTRQRGLTNVRLICSSCATGLEFEMLDAVLLLDTLHDVEDKDAVLGEIRRVLKPNGRLLYKDHTLRGAQLITLMKSKGFRMVGEGEMLSFLKC